MADPVLVLDTSPLNHFARAGRLDTLRSITSGYQRVTTRAVISELKRGAARITRLADAVALDWVRVVPCDDLDELYLFAQYMNRLGNAERNAGEASVLAWAEAHGAEAYVDDQVANNVARSRGVTVHRTLRLVVAAYRLNELTADDAQELIVALADTDARFPSAARDDLLGWARGQRLL